MPYCTHCGTETAVTARSCPECGRNLTVSHNSAKTAFFTIGLVLSLAVIVFTFSTSSPSTVAISERGEPDRPSGSIGSAEQPPELLPVNMSAAYAKSSYLKLCAEKYPTDFSMRAACSRNAQSGRIDFIEIWNRYLAIGSMNLALQNCYQRYTESGATDFAMLGACARNQEQGLKETS